MANHATPQTDAAAPRYIEERTYYPRGLDPDHYEAFHFQVGVFYRGNGKWCVATSREAHQQLSRTGKWLWLPLKMTALRWCRFTFDEACALAEAHVDARKINGLTFAEWEQRRRSGA